MECRAQCDIESSKIWPAFAILLTSPHGLRAFGLDWAWVAPVWVSGPCSAVDSMSKHAGGGRASTAASIASEDGGESQSTRQPPTPDRPLSLEELMQGSVPGSAARSRPGDGESITSGGSLSNPSAANVRAELARLRALRMSRSRRDSGSGVWSTPHASGAPHPLSVSMPVPGMSATRVLDATLPGSTRQEPRNTPHMFGVTSYPAGAGLSASLGPRAPTVPRSYDAGREVGDGAKPVRETTITAAGDAPTVAIQFKSSAASTAPRTQQLQTEVELLRSSAAVAADQARKSQARVEEQIAQREEAVRKELTELHARQLAAVRDEADATVARVEREARTHGEAALARAKKEHADALQAAAEAAEAKLRQAAQESEEATQRAAARAEAEAELTAARSRREREEAVEAVKREARGRLEAAVREAEERARATALEEARQEREQQQQASAAASRLAADEAARQAASDTRKACEAEMKSAVRDAVRDAKATHAEEMAALRASHEQALEALQQRYRHELDASHAASIHAREEGETAAVRVALMHAADAHSEELDAAERASQQRLHEALQAARAESKQQLQSELARQAAQAQAALEDAVAAARSEVQASLDELRDAHRMEMAAAQEEASRHCAREVARAKREAEDMADLHAARARLEAAEKATATAREQGEREQQELREQLEQRAARDRDAAVELARHQVELKATQRETQLAAEHAASVREIERKAREATDAAVAEAVEEAGREASERLLEAIAETRREEQAKAKVLVQRTREELEVRAPACLKAQRHTHGSLANHGATCAAHRMWGRHGHSVSTGKTWKTLHKPCSGARARLSAKLWRVARKPPSSAFAKPSRCAVQKQTANWPPFVESAQRRKTKRWKPAETPQRSSWRRLFRTCRRYGLTLCLAASLLA